LFQREKITRISGLAVFKALLETPEARIPRNLFFVLPTENAKAKTIEFARNSGYPTTADDCYVAPRFSVGQALPPAGAEQRQPEMVALQTAKSPFVEDRDLVSIIERRQPKHIIIGIGGGMQDKLGSYLKHQLSYRPAIYCIGAAPGFVTGDQVSIPTWADRFFVGWIFRIITQPRTLLPRFWSARRLPGIMIKYGREAPVAEIK